MCTTILASSSRHAIHELSLTTCLFPTSDLRSDDPTCFSSSSTTTTTTTTTTTATTTPQTTSPSISYLGNVNSGKKVMIYSDNLPLRTQIEPGVWSDGNDRVLSAACPAVQTFLKSARRKMVLPIAPSEPVFALAALEVFYRVDDPVHWMFWSDEKKYQTAEVVSRISLHRPQLIHSRVAWNGTPEYLFILSGLHGPTSLPLYEHKDWYLILNPSKIQSPPRVLNLRKRKVPPISDQSEPSGNADEEELREPRPKRSKSSYTANAKAPKDITVGTNQIEVAELSPITTSTLSLEDPDVLPSIYQAIPTPEEGDGLSLVVERTVRTRKRKACQPSNTTESFPILRETSPSSTSMLLTPSIPCHSRNRSTSQASSQTLVQARDRRSTSVLSAITAVEILSVDGEGDALKSDQAVSDPDDGRGESGMVTRGRANKARNAIQSEGINSLAKTQPKRKGGVR